MAAHAASNVYTLPLVTVMVTELLLVPPAPLQESVYVTFAVSGPTFWEPETAFVPDHPLDAEQAVALVDDQLRVELPLVAMVKGLAERETLTVPGEGAGPGGVVGVTLATFALPLPSPAPPPHPAISDASKVSKNPSDMEREIRCRSAAFPACAICIP